MAPRPSTGDGELHLVASRVHASRDLQPGKPRTIVFMIEAVFDAAEARNLRPGQPVDVRSSPVALDMNGDLVIDVQGITKRFGDRTVVNNIPMQVRRGEIYGFLGPNGSGKTPSCECSAACCGRRRRGKCLGFDIFTQPPRSKKRVGYMTQRFSFYEDLTIQETSISSRASTASATQGLRGPKAWKTLGLTGRRTTARGRTVRRLEAAPCARCLYDPRPRTLAPRRADRRRGPKARAISGRRFIVWRSRADGADHHALHGRSGRCHSLAYIAYGSCSRAALSMKCQDGPAQHVGSRRARPVGTGGEAPLAARRGTSGGLGATLHVSGGMRAPAGERQTWRRANIAGSRWSPAWRRVHQPHGHGEGTTSREGLCEKVETLHG